MIKVKWGLQIIKGMDENDELDNKLPITSGAPRI